MASVRKLVSGHYQVRFRDAGGRERSKTFAKKVHADKYRSQVEYELDRGDWLDPRAGEVRLVDWFEEAWDLATPVKRRTASDRRSNMNKHVLPTFGDRPLNRIDPEDVQRWVNGLSAAEYAPATVKKIFETLSGCCVPRSDTGVSLILCATRFRCRLYRRSRCGSWCQKR